MRPKGKLFALLAVFAAIGIVTATGAFTTVNAERTVNVAVSGDDSALLAMTPSNNPNGAYADTENDEIKVDISTSNPSQGADTSGNFSGTGVNPNATTEMDSVFNITNQGTQQIEITVSYPSNPDGFYLYNATNSGTDLNGSSVILDQGESMTVGVYVNTSAGFTAQEVNVVIEANAT